MSAVATAAALAALAALAGVLRQRAAERELVARACHELRAPLTAAHLAVDALAREPVVRADRLAALDGALHAARVALADLDAARNRALVPTRRRTVDLAEVLGSGLPQWQLSAAAAGRRVRMRAAPGVLVDADPERLLQAASNVVRNAVEHGRGDVELLAGARDGRARLEVRDRGRGLPAPVGLLTRRARGGRGMRGRGLAIAAEVASDHGGRLSAEGGAVVLEFPPARCGPARGWTA